MKILSSANENRLSPPPRLAASNYSNSAPLIWSFWRGARRAAAEFLPDAAPSKCAALLAAGKVDIALTPVIEFQRIENVCVVPRVCVGSARAVKSVILVTKGGSIENAESVALDASSKTSVALTKIIFREFFDKNPRFLSHAPDLETMLERADAALLIGDPALRVDREKYRVFDIVELWREFTGCGFVFAFWLARGNSAAAARRIDFAAARDEGLEKIEEILDFYRPQVPLEPADFRRYLLENIAYEIDDSMRRGLELYFELAAKHRLIERLKPLKFLT